jgi:hypothetical protein
VAKAVALQPQTTVAWASGAEGEARLGALLESVGYLRLLHDRRVPRTRGNIDHIVIGPAGIFIVDAKNHRGSLAIRNRGTIFSKDYRLTIAGRDCSSYADGLQWQIDAVRTALAGAGRDGQVPVTGVLCFLNADWIALGRWDSFRGVVLSRPKTIVKLLTQPLVIGEAVADQLLVELAKAFPPK